MQLLEGPHDGLHEVDVQGLVVVVEIDPARLAGDVVAPLVGVLEHRGLAVLVELGQTHDFDLGFVLDTELLLRFEFCGQAVAVPAEASLDLASTHGLEARHQVLDVPRQQVTVMRQAVCEGRSVVENELFATVPIGNRRTEGVVVVPLFQDFLFQFGELDSGVGGDTVVDFGIPVTRHGDLLVPVGLGTGTTWRLCADTAVPPRLHPVDPRLDPEVPLDRAVTGSPVRFY